ncbi:Lipopolysaccharide core biosynthesis mannosyltransferase LpcC, family GT4 [Tenacibaculum maritimum]|uniref:glycosyltransferase family 4 protein n=1 Tax=Tenacibaculum maritimum TaxID=107401 RepID=UPI0012E5FF48|nr:glycosyltransferase family 4 protein [Tenacibaculum maritimum]CAA0151618.1 Lipopolysaccharide core biosynthesis mannosyltransferase LpcC, family GT4 [Tenacibaculum maritimum]
MNSKPILIHTHFHKRRTGVTRSIENVLPFFHNNYQTYIYGYNVAGEKISFSKLISLLFSNKEVVVHCHRNNEILRLLLFRMLGARFKLIATRHAETRPSKLTKFLLRKSNKIITLTKSMSSSLGLKNTYIGHGINTSIFKPDPKKEVKGIVQSNIILCAGRVRKAKGQITLLKATIPILKEQLNWALVIVGKVDKPSFLEELKELVRKNNVQKQVYFIKETTDIISYYQASKIVVTPSFSEGFSLVCAEAMACGCNTIATKNVGVHSNLITNRKNGYLFKAGDVNSLNKLLLNNITGKTPLLGKEARKEIINEWSAQKEAKKLMEQYNFF